MKVSELPDNRAFVVKLNEQKLGMVKVVPTRGMLHPYKGAFVGFKRDGDALFAAVSVCSPEERTFDRHKGHMRATGRLNSPSQRIAIHAAPDEDVFDLATVVAREFISHKEGEYLDKADMGPVAQFDPEG